MCGFAGFVGEVDDREQVLVNMMNTIVHRGPDSAGKYVDEDAALGFRRLSIIDLSSVGDQPLYNEDRSMVLVFNGEIYNYQDLRCSMKRRLATIFLSSLFLRMRHFLKGCSVYSQDITLYMKMEK